MVVTSFLLQNSTVFNIQLNIKDKIYGKTAFHMACKRGHLSIVELMIENRESFNLDLSAKDNHGRTGYQVAKEFGQTDVINLIEEKLPSNFFLCSKVSNCQAGCVQNHDQ